MEITSLLMSAGGLLLSVYAVYTATTAKSAIDQTVKKVNIQRDISEISDILEKLIKAKSAANIWIPGAVDRLQIGRDRFEDLETVRNAEDALAVWVPVDMQEDATKRLRAFQADLHSYCEKISDPDNNENHWNGVVGSTQSLIRLLRERSRALENSQLVPSG